MSYVPTCIIDRLETIQKDFLWNGKRAKVKHLALINTYENGGLKSMDIMCKIKALQLSWVKRLYEGSFYPWKHIPKKILENSFTHNIFLPNLCTEIPKDLPMFYDQILKNWILVQLDLGHRPLQKCPKLTF